MYPLPGKPGYRPRLVPLVLVALAGLAGLGFLLFSGRLVPSPFAAAHSGSPTRTPVLAAPAAVLPTATMDVETQKAQWGTTDIRDLVKDPDKYNGVQVHYTGELFDVQETATGSLAQVLIPFPDTNPDDRAAVMVFCNCLISAVFKGRNVEFWGNTGGTMEVATAPEGNRRQPLIFVTSAEYLRLDQQ